MFDVVAGRGKEKGRQRPCVYRCVHKDMTPSLARTEGERRRKKRVLDNRLQKDENRSSSIRHTLKISRNLREMWWSA